MHTSRTVSVGATAYRVHLICRGSGIMYSLPRAWLGASAFGQQLLILRFRPSKVSSFSYLNGIQYILKYHYRRSSLEHYRYLNLLFTYRYSTAVFSSFSGI